MPDSARNQTLQTFSTLAEVAAQMNAEGRYDEADSLILGVLATKENSPAALLCYLNLARDRGDLFGVVDRASRLRSQLPSNPVGYLREIEALRILGRLDLAGSLLAEAMKSFSNTALFLSEDALLAEARGDWDVVDQRMRALREAAPNEVSSWLQSVGSLMRSGRYSLAETLLNQIPRGISNDAKLLSLRATVAESLRQWQEADRRWKNALSMYPDRAEIALGHAVVWSNPPPSERENRDWPRTFERLNLLRLDFPNFAGGYAAHIRLLQQTDKLQEAQILADTAAELFPKNPTIAISRSRLAAKQKRYEQATHILMEIIASVTNDPFLRAELASVLRQGGKLEDAEIVCREACSRFPYHPRPFIEYAEIAMQRGDARVCLERWADGAKRFPQHDTFHRGLAAAHLTMIGLGHDEIAALTEGSASVGQDPSLRQHFFGFESLGGPAFGCEFGLVQQRAGANPLSLLRWADISLTNLQEAFKLRFQGVGNLEQINFYLHPESEEYTIIDQRFSIKMHSFLRYDTLPHDLLVEDTSRRLTYLKNKLLKDLEAAKKIFVFRLGKSEVCLEKITALYEQFEKISSGVLLCIASATSENEKPGSLTILAPRLLLGYVDELQTWGLTNFTPWHEVCRQARDIANKL